LAVDDAPENLELAVDILENAGITTLVVRSGASALSLIGQVKAGSHFVDALMPKMDGFETCRRIKSSGNSRYPDHFHDGVCRTRSTS